MNTLHNGDCLEVMATLPDNSVDAVITDPPYELGFMGKSWDNTGIAYNVDMWQQALRVLKPGGHMLAFSGTRTYHRMACAIEDAGFEIRDMIEWIYGSGFPKSLNIGKAVDKLQGNERMVIGRQMLGGNAAQTCKEKGGTYTSNTNSVGVKPIEIRLTTGTSPYEGWHTALKPAHEPICLCRKPLSERNVAANVLKWGTGGINVDACRVGTDEIKTNAKEKGSSFTSVGNSQGFNGCSESVHTGRFPANLIHDGSDEVKACFPETRQSKRSVDLGVSSSIPNVNFMQGSVLHKRGESHDDLGGNASRYFKSIVYTAKASKSDRGEGNIHATVKPTALMEYLITMIAPPTATVLDPFMGSGTTGVAARRLDRDFIGIELDPDYFKIAQARIQDAGMPLFEQAVNPGGADSV